MPRSRGSDTTAPSHHQRASPRAPLHLRATANTTADSNGSSVVVAHHNGGRPIRDRSPKLEEHRRSPRSPLPEVGVCTTAQKKRATRVADLETRLSHAQDELRKLREQLASAEAAKKDAQQELQETKKKKNKGTAPGSAAPSPAKKKNGELDNRACDKECPLLSSGENQHKEKKQDEEEEGGEDKEQKQGEHKAQEKDEAGEDPKVAAAEEWQQEPTAPVIIESACEDAKEETVKEPTSHAVEMGVTAADSPKEEKIEEEHGCGRDVEEQANTAVEGEDQHPMTVDTTATSTTEQEEVEEQVVVIVKPPSPAAAAEEEMLELETRLWKKDKDLDLLRSENASLKSHLADSESTAAALADKVALLESSMDDQRRAAEAKLAETEAARAALEVEVRRLRVQTEQWRKAADAAAAIISGEDFDGAASGALGGRRVAERCGSMDKYIGGAGSGGLGFDAAAVLGSPLLMEGAEADGAAAAGKRRGIRVFGDLWKKKGHTGGGANK